MDDAGFKDLTARSIECWNKDGPEAMVGTFWAESIVLRESEAFPDATIATGADAVQRRLTERGTHVSGTLALEHAELISEGLGLVQLRVSIEGEGSGVAMDFSQWVVTRFEGELVTEMAEYLDEHAARAHLEAR